MRVADIRVRDTGNGPGARTSIWVTGCTHACPGCFNADIQDFNAGEDFTEKHKAEIIEALSSPYSSGLSLLGGEPMQNFHGLIPLLEEIRPKLQPHQTIWLWTGYTWDMVVKVKKRRELASLCDVVVDGLWVESLYDKKLKWRGSSNQRIIDAQKSLETGEVVLYGAVQQ